MKLTPLNVTSSRLVKSDAKPQASQATGLPNDVLENVFARLPAPELVRCGIVCKDWYRLVAAEPLWDALARSLPAPLPRTATIRRSVTTYHAACANMRRNRVLGTQLLADGFRVDAVEFSPDAKCIAIARGGTVEIRDIATWDTVVTVEHPKVVQALAFSPDSQQLLTGCEDGIARFLDAATGHCLASNSLGEAVSCVSFGPDGKHAALGGAIGRVRVVLASSGATHASVAGASYVKRVRFTPNGRTVASTGWEGKTHLIDMATAMLRVTLDHGDQAQDLAFSPDGHRLAVAHLPNAPLKIYDTAIGVPWVTSRQRQLTVVAFTPDGKKLVVGGWDEAVHVLDVYTGHDLLRIPHGESINAIAITPDGSMVAITSWKKGTQIADLRTGKTLARIRHGHAVHGSVRFSPDGTMLAAGSRLFAFGERPAAVPKLLPYLKAHWKRLFD